MVMGWWEEVVVGGGVRVWVGERERGRQGVEGGCEGVVWWRVGEGVRSGEEGVECWWEGGGGVWREEVVDGWEVWWGCGRVRCGGRCTA